MRFDSHYYDSIRPFLPDDAKQVLATQVPLIEEKIKKEIDDFAKSFAKQIAEEVTKVTAETTADAAKLQTELKTRLTNLAPLLATATGSLQQDAQALHDAIAAYNKKYTDLGKTVKDATIKAAQTALAASGLPFPVDLLK